MKLLAIETATEACSAALYQDGDIISRYQVEPRQHSRLILPMMDDLLAEAELSLQQLDAVAFGAGPGSFTGVRIATGVIQGVAFAADLPVVPVSTLVALAQGGYRQFGQTHWMPVFDARMHEIYWTLCHLNAQGVMQQSCPAQVSDPASIELTQSYAAIGTGWSSYSPELSERLSDQLSHIHADIHCHAQDVAVLGAMDFKAGKSVSPDQALPVYLRNNVAKKSTKVNLLAH